MKNITRITLFVIGTLFLFLGILGIFLPLLPTTPFLLLAAACYSRSSSRFYQWLLTNRWSGEYIRNYREGKGIRLKQKVLMTVLLWVTIGFSAWLLVELWWIKVILFFIAVLVTIHILSRKTYKPDLIDN